MYYFNVFDSVNWYLVQIKIIMVEDCVMGVNVFIVDQDQCIIVVQIMNIYVFMVIFFVSELYVWYFFQDIFQVLYGFVL